MNTAVETLFSLLRRKVTLADIREFSPCDPGYEDYVLVWSKVLETGELPDHSDFDLSEVIRLRGYSNPTHESYAHRFCVYRLFVMTVACHLLRTTETDILHPASYIAIKLIRDAKEVADGTITGLLGDVLSETGDMLKGLDWLEEEYPFFYAAEMVWAQRVCDYTRADAVARKLLAEEQRVRQHEENYSGSPDYRFLFGLTIFNQLEEEWELAFRELVNPNECEDTQLVIDALRA